MANQQDLQQEQRRLTILQLLKQDPGYQLNDAMLQELLRYRGIRVSYAVIYADLAWLEELNLVTTDELPGCTVAHLRNAGVDVADGVSHIPGIARPRPE